MVCLFVQRQINRLNYTTCVIWSNFCFAFFFFIITIFFKLYYSHEDDKFLCRKKKMNKILWSYSWYSWWWWWWLLKLWKTKIKNSIWNINSNEKKSCCFCLKYLKNWKKMKFDFLRLVIIIYFALNLNFLTQMAWTFET